MHRARGRRGSVLIRERARLLMIATRLTSSLGILSSRSISLDRVVGSGVTQPESIETFESHVVTIDTIRRGKERVSGDE